MGQNLSDLNSQIIDLLEVNTLIPSPTTITAMIGPDDVRFFSTSDINKDTSTDKYQTSKQWTIRIQNYLNLLTNIPNLESVTTKMDVIFLSIKNDYEQIIQEINSYHDIEEKLKISLLHKCEDGNDNTVRLSLESNVSKLFHSTDKYMSKMVSHLNKPNIDSTASNQHITGTQLKSILHKCLTSNISLRYVLSILKLVVFDTHDIYNVRHLFTRFNDHFISFRHDWETEQKINSSQAPKKTIDTKLLEQLTSLEAYPNIRVKNKLPKRITGQFVSLFILTHIDFHNTAHANKQFHSSSIHNSMSFDFHSDTYNELFDIIKQLTELPIDDLNMQLTYILIVCLRLFAMHLKFLFAIATNPSNDLLLTRDDRIQINLNDLNISQNDLQTWFATLLTLAYRESDQLEHMIICGQASKCLIQILNSKISCFTEKLSFIYQHIMENKHYILIKALLIELNTNGTLLNWIEVLCSDKFNNTVAFNLLYSLLGIYFDPSNTINPKLVRSIQQLIQRFQKLVFIKLSTTYSLANKYITYIFNHYNGHLDMINDLLNPILIGLGLMTDTNFNFTTIQEITTHILPVFSEFILNYSTSNTLAMNNLYYIYWLLAKMTSAMIMGPKTNALEIKYIEKLESPLFAGGCEKLTLESNQYLSNLSESTIAKSIELKKTPANFVESDQDFLMSIYNDIDQGAQLMSKMKMSTKDKQYLLQKSIEQQANHCCAALFAVYLKLFRRINLAKNELNRVDDKKPHRKLLSVFEHATQVYFLFGRTKGQGGDCEELYHQIRTNTLFLLTSVKESNLIPIVQNEFDEQRYAKIFKRQYSRRPVKKHDFQLIRNTLLACMRFRKIMIMTKKSNEEKQRNENILKKLIDHFIFNEKKIDSNELIQCMSQQYERSMIRFVMYEFSYRFIDKLFNNNDKKQILIFLRIYLSYLRKTSIPWSYLENISTTNIQLKEDISRVYYSIIKRIFSYISSSGDTDQTILIQNMFYLLNLPYEMMDIDNLYKDEFLAILSSTSMNSNIDIKFIFYTWFRLYVFKFCEGFQRESNSMFHPIRELIFNIIILNELKLFKQLHQPRLGNKIINESHSLNNVAIQWFIKAKDANNSSTKFEINLYINQYLVLLLRCMNFYEHVESYCANDKYIEELIYIYENSDNQITCLLCLKILRRILIFFTDEKARSVVNHFLTNILFSIGKTTPDITTELIHVYRTLMSFESKWQIMTIEIIFNTILSNLKSFQSIDNVLASLCVLGGYIEPFCLGSIVEIRDTDETQLGVIIDMNRDALKTNTNDVQPYLVQYISTNQIQWISEDKLRIELQTLPPNLLDLPNINEYIDSFFDALIYFIQYNSVTIDSLLRLELKRRAIAVLYRVLNHKDIVDIFIQKPYLTIIAELSKTHKQQIDLHLFNKRQLEAYCLSLDRCKPLKQTTIDTNQSINEDFRTWTNIPFKANSSGSDDDYSSTNEWKSSMSKRDLQSFKKGRIGNDDIKITELSSQLSGKWFVEECGLNHLLLGRFHLISEDANTLFATFSIENLQLTEGKWYFCIRLLESTSARVGWLTNGFTPNAATGIGQDQYSWSYDGSQGMIYNNEQYPFHLEDIRWSLNDVCGCGIEIQGDQTKINYWLNGYYLGTAFQHNMPMNSTTEVFCNMLPNGTRTSYSPAVTLKVDDTAVLSSCEFIFHPMDMFECPMPEGYKPLVIPNLSDIDDSYVPYPCNAYLIGNNEVDYFVHKRNKKSERFLRDFINQHHLENEYSILNNQLILPEHSKGFPLTMEDNEPWTISFDFSLLKTSKDYVDIPLLIFDTYSIRIPTNKVLNNTQTAIVYQSNEQILKVYVNNECRIFQCPFINKRSIYILPESFVGIQNLAIWKYALFEEHIQRLFTSGLSYIAVDYHRFSEYHKQANLLTFHQNQNYFENDLLLPFNEPFDEMRWEQKKIQLDEDESKYFNRQNESIQLFGNKTYLVLSKSIDPWSEYTLIFDILINHFPTAIVRLNSQTEIYITTDGQLCLTIDNENNIQNKTKIKQNEYIRFVISVCNNNTIRILINGSLEISTNLSTHPLTISDKHIDLFRESNLREISISEDTLRIECKSITYLDKPVNVIDDIILTSPAYSLESLVAYPYSLVSPSLIRIGYVESLIEIALKQTMSRNIQLIDTILRENKFNQYNEHVLSKLGFSIDKNKLKDNFKFSQFDSEEKLPNLAKILLEHWNDIQAMSSSEDKNWFQQAVQYLNIDDNFTKWIRDESTTGEQTDILYQLFDLNQSVQEQADAIKDNIHFNDPLNKIDYNHRDLTYEKYCECRTACEYGLISVYAQYTILNMLKVWSYDGSSLFPLERFDDCTFIIKLLQLLDYHYKHTRLDTDESIDRMSLLIHSILKIELNELIKYSRIKTDKISYEILQSNTPLLYHLQKKIIIQSIKIFIDPLLLISEYNNEHEIEIPNFNFILKLVHLFVKLISEKSLTEQEDIDLLIPLLFPESLIHVLFNLFLINPQHEHRCIILRLFSTLLQTSNHFNLSKNIQQFLFRLFIELPPNSALVNTQTVRTLQVTLVDLVFLLSERQKYRLTSIDLTDELATLPQSFHDLLIIVGVIKAVTDRTKRTPFPESFIIESTVLLGENFQFTRDDIEQSNKHFDRTSDLQLIHFMNNNQLLKRSFAEFINSLPTEPTPNSTYYKNYPSLWHIPAVHIQTRVKLIYQCNLIVEKLVPFIDLSLFPGQSILTDKIQNSKSYILFETKSKLFSTTLTITKLENNVDMPTVNFDTVQATSSNEHTMFQQAYEQLHANAHITFRSQHNQVWCAQYLAMHSTDQGGPFRDSVTRMCSDIFSTRSSLFILCPNGRTNSGLNDDRWIPNIYPPNEPMSNRTKKQYVFIGQLMGMAIRKKHYLHLKFPSLLWKRLIREQITVEDIENIDAQSFTMIKEMEKSIIQNNSSDETNELLSSILDELRYEAVGSNGQTYELVPNGKNIPITVSNLKDYCTSYREYRLNEFNRQIDCIRQGLYSVIPGYFLGLFTASELEEMVCGKGEIDIDLLKRNTNYGGRYNQYSPCIKHFWTILREMFSEEQKKLFLKFVWGRCTLPNCDDDFRTEFRIEPYTLSDHLIDGALPRAHTCSFVLDLPEYSTISIMYDRLNYAITYCTCIDGDGNMNDDPTPADLDSGSDSDSDVHSNSNSNLNLNSNSDSDSDSTADE